MIIYNPARYNLLCAVTFIISLYDKNVLQLHHGYPTETTPEELTKIAQKIAFEK